jgi:dolichol-phosphate mannosyltransferase
MRPSISIIVPALNEERNLRPTVETILEAVDDRFWAFEVIIFDDHSNDSTGIIADALAMTNQNIKVIHNPSTMGYGYNFKRGVEVANFDYIVMFPGDDDVEGSSMQRMFELIGRADCVIGYTLNVPCDRPLWRRIISRFFTLSLNVAFGLNLRYYNGPVIHRKDIIKNIPLTTYGFAFQAEALTKILRSGHSFIEVGITLRGRRFGRTKAFKLKNVKSVIKTALKLFWTVRIRERKRYNKKGRRIELK